MLCLNRPLANPCRTRSGPRAKLWPVSVLLLHPGAMGSSLGAALVANEILVQWVTEGRSGATEARAEADGIVAVSDLAAGLEDAEIVISVCPPAFAADVAAQVAAQGFAGIYLDANAISPATARDVADTVAKAGSTPLDGGIIGPPARGGARTLLYLSGHERAREEVADHFSGAAVEVVALDAGIGAASATKMAFAAWTKGSAALLMAVRALAESHDVVDGLDHAWEALLPHLAEQLRASAAGSGPKAWRFEAEMSEIAATFAAANLPPGFHEAAAEIFGRLSELRNREGVDVDDVISLLTL